jgi:hypothetical protein
MPGAAGTCARGDLSGRADATKGSSVPRCTSTRPSVAIETRSRAGPVWRRFGAKTVPSGRVADPGGPMSAAPGPAAPIPAAPILAAPVRSCADRSGEGSAGAGRSPWAATGSAVARAVEAGTVDRRAPFASREASATAPPGLARSSEVGGRWDRPMSMAVPSCRDGAACGPSRDRSAACERNASVTRVSGSAGDAVASMPDSGRSCIIPAAAGVRGV